ncbi:MAG: DUF1801 domain-containing protein [Gordonia sp. (in: high G+C Gram-positive bacteria)]|uniref:iron chaperone n=1 Tax=Gordonia sp. (in: high G+C Gram-positive bacteria) TaxID=84139 RepID=UPI0039E4842F
MPKFTTVDEFLDDIPDPEHRAKLAGILDWVGATWQQLEPVMKWNQPMFLDHGTYIIGFSVFAKNIAVGPETAVLDRMRERIHAAGYTTTKQLIRIGWDQPIDHDLLASIIDLQITEKAGVTTLWRP